MVRDIKSTGDGYRSVKGDIIFNLVTHVACGDRKPIVAEIGITVIIRLLIQKAFRPPLSRIDSYVDIHVHNGTGSGR